VCVCVCVVIRHNVGWLESLPTPAEGELLLRLGIDGTVDILQAHFAVISSTFRIRGRRNHHVIRRYYPDDIIDPLP
jgi:hypothetical protein